MTLPYEHSRYIPDSKTNDILTSIHLAQIEPLRTYANTFSAVSDIGSGSPFNPRLNTPVTYSPKVSLNCAKHPPSTKYDNHYRGSNSTALYDPKIYNRDAQPYFLNNVQQKQLAQSAQDRIQLKNDLNPKAYNGGFSGNGFLYNPNLPESETNKRPESFGPSQKDERLHAYHTNDREYNYEHDRAIIADNLRRSEDLKERNARQLEADSALNHWAHHDRNYEPKQEYRHIQPTSQYRLSEDDVARASKQNDRNVAPEFKQKEAFVNSRTHEFDANDINHLTDAIDRSYSPDIDRQQTVDFLQANLRQRIEQFSTDESVANAHGNSSTNIVERFADYISDVVLGAFGWNKNKDRSVETASESFTNVKERASSAHLAKFDSDGSIRVDYVVSQNTETDNSDLSTLKTFNSGLSKNQYDRREHMLVVKNGELIDAYPDEDNSYTAVSFIDEDPLVQNGFNRHIIMLDGGKLTIIQKRAEEAIFQGEKLGDDVLVIELPIEAVDYKVRERLFKLNTGTKRDKVLELTYDDFVLFRDYIVKHPELQERLKVEQLHFRVRGNTYDEDIIHNFEGRKTFTSDAVYNALAANAREHLIQHRKGRVEKPIESAGIDSTQTPIQRNIKRESLKPPQLSIPRIVGVKRGQFDGIKNV